MGRLKSGIVVAWLACAGWPMWLGAAPLPVVRFSADEWPPFVTAALPGDGLSGALVAAVYQRLGMRSEIEYFPWKRAMEFGLHNPRYAGLLPVWRTPEREKLCHFSSSIGSTQTVLAFLKAAPVRPDTLAGLRGVRLGTVAGYAYGEQFDAARARGDVSPDESVNDETNLRKLLIGRYSVIVIERHVLDYLLHTPQFGPGERERVGIADNLFKERPVTVCFKHTPQGLEQQKAFNGAARELDLERLEREYWKRAHLDGGGTLRRADTGHARPVAN
ncbi:substrate-binding periplasmic protein [Rugamonas apoptosis]|nr:transporter substrate-binding domain-containing protein [Rugamonas apoptosis]